jgi:ATP-dependent DNA ligase
LAVPTEDHPLEYKNFEGTIPEGEYGAGHVIVWDTGTYRNLTHRDGRLVPLATAIEQGHAVVWLDGVKLKGGFALTKICGGPKPVWLLVKMADEYADAHHDILKRQPGSVLAHRSHPRRQTRARDRRDCRTLSFLRSALVRSAAPESRSSWNCCATSPAS